MYHTAKHVPILVLIREPSQGIGLIAVAVAGVAALWWWRKIATDDGQVCYVYLGMIIKVCMRCGNAD